MYKVLVYCVLLSLVNVVIGETGLCSWYSGGGNTANGESFNDKDMTAAHETLPFNSKVRVIANGRSVKVRINDRGPFVSGRILDLSRGAAQKLGAIRAGVVKCTLVLI